MATLRDIGVSALINVGLTILFLLGFIILSVQPVNDRVYYPKLYIKGVRKGRPRASPRQLKAVEKYFNLECWQYLRVFQWAKSALHKTEDDIIQHAGLDSAVFLRIFSVGLKIFVPLMILGMAILVPVNVGAGSLAESGTTNVNANSTDTKFLFSSIDRLSMSNVPNGSPRLWAHLVMAYVFTAWVCLILFMEYKSIAALRLRFLSDEKRRPDQFTVMALQIPDRGMDPMSKQVEDYFSKNHPDHYLTHQMAYNATKLTKIVKERDKAQNWLDYFEVKQKRNPAMRPMTKTGLCGIMGDQIDAIDYYTSRVQQLTQEAEAEREVVINDAKATMPAAFVSFKTRWGAAVCAQTQQNQDPTLWLTDWAPEPRDVYWANLAIPYVQLGFRKLAVGAIVFLLVFFYMIPVAGVQSLANLEGLRRSIPALDGFLKRSFVASFVQGFLPGLALKLCFRLLPAIIMLITKLEGHLAISKIERRAAAKYYYFVVVNIFFGSMLTGSAFQQLKTFVKSSSFLGFVNTLASSIPQNASFFITYIMVDGWSGPAGEILRLKQLVKYHIRNSLFCRTDKDRLHAASPGTLTLDRTLPQLLLYFLMGLVYSVITPVILPFIIIFLAFGFVVYRYQVINVYDPVYESAGAFWPHVHGRIVASLILEHLTLLGLFLVKGPISFVQTPPGRSLKHKILRYVRDSCSSTPFMIALPILTLFFHNYCKKRFEPAFTNYPLENAMEKDAIEKQDEPDLNLAVFLRNAYKHPDFSDEKDDADVENGQDEEDEKMDSLSADEFVELSDSEDEEEQESSPLHFKWGAFHQTADQEDDTPTFSQESGSPLTFSHGFFYGEGGSILEGELRRDSMGRYHSARSFFDSASSRSNFSVESDAPSDYTDSETLTDGDGELARVRSLQRYLQGQLSRESSLMASLRVRDDVTRLLSRAPSANSNESQNQLESQPESSDDDDEKAILQRFMRAQLSRQNSGEDDDALRTAYLQGYLRGHLSRENSSAESSPFVRSRQLFQDSDETLNLQRYMKRQLSRQNSGSESGSPLPFRRGASFETLNSDGDGASPPSFPDSPGSPLTFRTGRFGDSPLPRFSRAQTMSTIREASEMDSDAQRGHFSRAKTFGVARYNNKNDANPKPGSPQAEIVPAPAYSRTGTRREVIYLDSPSFVRPNLKRAKTLSTLLKEPQETLKAPRQRNPKPKMRTSTTSMVKDEAETEQSNSFLQDEAQDQPSTSRREASFTEKIVQSSSSSSSSSSENSQNASPDEHTKA